MDENIFKNDTDYWMVAQNIKDIYMSEGSMLTLMDFERVLDELDIYAFKNWEKGELVAGPAIERYSVSCTFMWPKDLMPDPRGGKRLLPFDINVKWKKTKITIPIKIENPSDYANGTKVAKLVKKPVWLVEIVMPKSLISDIRTGSIELEGDVIDLEDIDSSYQNDLDQEEYVADDNIEAQTG